MSDALVWYCFCLRVVALVDVLVCLVWWDFCCVVLGYVGCLVCELCLWLVFWLVWFGGVLLCGFGWCELFGLWFVALIDFLVGLIW